MDDIKNRIEAVLFTTGRFVDLDELSSLTGIGSIGSLREALNSLIEDYKNKESSLEIVEDNGKFKLNIKKDFLYLTTKLLSETEFDKPTQETLALIAYKQPVMQSEIIKMRGTTGYDHVKKLKEMEFVTSEKSGRTRLLKTTPKFYDYFDVVGTEIKEKFNEIENQNSISGENEA
ncbi:MAG: SMC-Scp complex subunit ScpB [Nanoarchaeota archaeon]|nr:SMC-Scp complex subunit ScpB [Nanoarchaeota archaeon]